MTFVDIGVDIGDTPITLSRHAVGQIAELLQHCEAFLRHASPNTLAELLGFLDQQPARPDAGWLIDMLGFDALFLQAKLAVAAETAAEAAAEAAAGQESS
jgi:hypothetical protein